MALCPFADIKLIPESHTQRKIVPAIIIDHAQAGTGSLYNFWLTGSNLESTFWIARSGRIEQYMDTETQADANLEANSWLEGKVRFGAVSIETENSKEATFAAYKGGKGGSAFDHDPWTPEQLASLKKLHAWLADTHSDIKQQRCNAPTKGGRGLGYHSMWGTGPSPWIPYSSRGKTCPGADRIAQFNTILLPAFTNTAPAEPAQPPPGELIMDADATKAFQDTVAEVRLAKQVILNALNPLAHKSFAVQGPDGKTWVCQSDATRYVIHDQDQLNVQIFVGDVQGLGTSGIPKVDDKFLAGWKITDAPK